MVLLFCWCCRPSNLTALICLLKEKVEGWFKSVMEQNKMEGRTHSDINVDGFWFFLESLITHITQDQSLKWAGRRAGTVTIVTPVIISSNRIFPLFLLLALHRASRPILSSTEAVAIDAIDVNYWTIRFWIYISMKWEYAFYEITSSKIWIH